MKKSFLLLSFLLTLLGCSSESDLPNVSHIPMQINQINLDKQIQKIQNTEQALAFLSANPEFAAYYVQSGQISYDTAAADFVRIAQSPLIDTLSMLSEKQFGNEKLQKDLENAFRYIKYYFPDFQTPRVYTMLTGFGFDLVVQPHFIIISLDYFLKNSPYRHPEMPDYVFKRYRPEFIVPYICQMISGKYNKSAFLDKTMLAEMIFYGKSLQFVRMTNPQTPDSVIMGYGSQELADLRFNNEFVWSHFVENNLFYEKNHFVKNKYLSERPFTSEISSKSAGRIGQWIGWEIVKQYMVKNPTVSLDSLMKNEDAQQIFEASKYKPFKEE